MITPERIETLAKFDGGGARVLSLCLDLDSARQVRRSYRVAFDDLVKEARERLEPQAHEALLREAARVRKWLESEKPHGRGLALFSCEPRDLWQAQFLPTRLEDHLEFEPAPDVAPLIEVMDEYEAYAVALVDKVKARLFVVFLGEIQETDAFADLMTSEHDRAGGSQARSQSHLEAHVHRHLKRVAQRLSEILGRRRFDRLILAGPEEATSDLRRILPRPLANRLVGAIPAEARMTERLTIGYRSAVTRVVSPLGALGVDLRGHEFHRTVAEPAGDALALTGRFGESRAGFASPTMFASYLHQHIATSPAIAERFVAAAAGQGLRATQPTI